MIASRRRSLSQSRSAGIEPPRRGLGERGEHQLVEAPLGDLRQPVAVGQDQPGGRGRVAQVVLLDVGPQQELQQPRLAHAGRADDRGRFAGAQQVEQRRGDFGAVGEGVYRADFGHESFHWLIIRRYQAGRSMHLTTASMTIRHLGDR